MDRKQQPSREVPPTLDELPANPPSALTPRPSGPLRSMTRGRLPRRQLWGPEPRANPSVGNRTPAILIIEQRDNLALFMQEVLEGAGYNVICTSNLQKARVAMRASAFDLLILEWPTETEWAENLLSTLSVRPGQPCPPTIVAVGGGSGSDQERQALAQGAAHIMHKPFGLKKLLSSVDRVLAKIGHGRL
ncbi:MAG: response regulator [Planctomycetes bacterium]|nr:response regulator [Planctomycetota bacterium]